MENTMGRANVVETNEEYVLRWSTAKLSKGVTRWNSFTQAEWSKLGVQVGDTAILGMFRFGGQMPLAIEYFIAEECLRNRQTELEMFVDADITAECSNAEEANRMLAGWIKENCSKSIVKEYTWKNGVSEILGTL